jgi:hypothetical protein
VNIGEALANARCRAGLSVIQVSEQTRIRQTIIAAIEGDDYSACGGDFYARGHIRAIAAAVGTDPGPLIEQYDAARVGPRAPAEEVTEPLPAVRMPQQPRPGPAASAGMRQERPPAGPVTRTARRGRPRRPPAGAVALGVVLVAGLGCAGYLLTTTGHAAAPSAGAHPATPRRASQASHAVSAARGGTQTAPAPTATTPAAATPRTLTPASATAFDASGGPGDNSDLAAQAIDGNPATAWHTDWYATARFGNLYPGTGLLVDMGRPVTITAAAITLGRAHGASLQLRVGAAPTLASLRPVARAADAGGLVRLRPTRPAHGRYVLLWFTRLPPGPAGNFQAAVYGLHLQGRT